MAGKRGRAAAGRGAQVSKEPRRRLPRQERARITVAAIVEAAEILLVEVGYAAASTNAIARRAGVSIGTLYQYFEGKEAVFQAVLDKHNATMGPIQRRAVRDLAAGEELRVVLARAMEESLAERDRDPELMQALERELEPVAARWDHGAPGHHHDGPDPVARLLVERDGLDPREAGVRSWLVMAVMQAVGRRVVHGSLTRRERRRALELTTEMVARMVEEE